MCNLSYQNLKNYSNLEKTKPGNFIGTTLRILFAVSIASVITALLCLGAFVLYQKLSFYNTELPYHFMKSVIRAHVYADHRIPEITLDESKTVYHNYPIVQPKIVSCYYNTPTEYKSGQLLPTDIHPHLCTHINVAFARIVNKEISLEDVQYQVLVDIIKLKKVNPDLKILLSIGGAGNENGFSDMVINHASRKIFIKSIKRILHDYTLDGIDLDWEFPAIHLQKNLITEKREKQHFSQLLREIRSEYIREKHNYILTVAVAAPETIVDVSYDVDQLNLYTDYVNIMTYDFHSYTKFTPFTGLNSPLYPRDNEQLYLATLNINYTTQMYINKGLNKSKIVIGIPTYGHSFTLVNPDNTMIGSPASGFGSLGGMGFVNYPEICLFVNRYSDVMIQQDKYAKVPYLYRGKEWVSYDSPASVALKADYVKRLGLGGAMIYSLNADDFGGLCDRERGAQFSFPLSQSVKNTLLVMEDNTSTSRRETSVAA